MTDNHPNFIAHIRKYVSLNDSEIEILLPHVKTIKAKKRDYLLEEGQICRSNYFVEEGCLRLFFINEKGTEQITQFALENWWLADYMSFGMQTRSDFYIQAVEDSEIVAIDYAKQEQLFNKLPQLERYTRMILQRAYAASQFRLKFMHSFSKEESYHHFITMFPEFVQRIPQKMLASYLGFTPEYLSELRKKVS